jgi:hypothetical protein
LSLSERTRKFVMDITTNGTSPEAAAKAVGFPVSAVPALMSNPSVRRDIDVSLEKQGITPVYFASKLRELCEALTPKGDPDYKVQLSALGMVKDILSYDAPKKVEQTNTTVTYEERLLMISDETGIKTHTIKEIT